MTASEDEGSSSFRLLSPSLGDWLKAAEPESKVASVSIKDRAASRASTLRCRAGCAARMSRSPGATGGNCAGDSRNLSARLDENQ